MSPQKGEISRILGELHRGDETAAEVYDELRALDVAEDRLAELSERQAKAWLAHELKSRPGR